MAKLVGDCHENHGFQGCLELFHFIYFGDLESLVQLIARLLIAVLGFIAPILAILLTIFRDGAEMLRSTYEKELMIKNEELKKLAADPNSARKDVKKRVRDLRREERALKFKIKRLNPRRVVTHIFLPLVLSFIFLVSYFGLMDESNWIQSYLIPTFFTFSAGLFILSLNELWRLLEIIIDVRKFITDDKRQHEKRKIELLREIVTKVSSSLTKENIHLKIGKEKLEDGANLQVGLGDTRQLSLSLLNEAQERLDMINVKLTLPKQAFKVESDKGCSVEQDETCSSLSYQMDSLMGTREEYIDQLGLSCLVIGVHEIRVLIEANNMNVPIEQVWKITVVESVNLGLSAGLK